MAAHSITNLFYILRKVYSVEERREVLLNIYKMVEVEGITKDNVLDALKDIGFQDFEACLQMKCGENRDVDYIVTRNVKDFANEGIKVVTPSELLEIF